LLKLYRNFKLSAFERLVLVSWILLRKAGVPPVPQANLEYGFLEVLLERVNVLRVFLMAMVCKDSPRSINGTELVSNSSNIFVKKQGSIQKLGGGFKDFLFSSLFGEDSQFDYYFSNGLKPPTRKAAPNFSCQILLRQVMCPQAGFLPMGEAGIAREDLLMVMLLSTVLGVKGNHF